MCQNTRTSEERKSQKKVIVIGNMKRIILSNAQKQVFTEWIDGNVRFDVLHHKVGENVVDFFQSYHEGWERKFFPLSDLFSMINPLHLSAFTIKLKNIAAKIELLKKSGRNSLKVNNKFYMEGNIRKSGRSPSTPNLSTILSEEPLLFEWENMLAALSTSF